MSYKEITRNSYEATASAFAHNVADLAPVHSIERLIKLLPAKAKILDLGCGSGRDSKIFTEHGLSVHGIDFCTNLIAIAKMTAPLAEFQVQDIEEVHFPDGSFDGVWACCALSHIPKKKLPSVLKNIHELLKENGHFYLTVEKGSGEVLKKDTRYEGDFKKFWPYYEEEELKKIIESANFKIIECCSVQKKASYPTNPCVRIFCQKQ